MQVERFVDRRESVFNVSDGEIVGLHHSKYSLLVAAIRVEFERKPGEEWTAHEVEVHGPRVLKDGSDSASAQHSQTYYPGGWSSSPLPEWLKAFIAQHKDEVTA